MSCDRSAYYQKAIKATARRLKMNTDFCGFFMLLGRLNSVSLCLSGLPINHELLRTNLLISFRSSYLLVSEVR